MNAALAAAAVAVAAWAVITASPAAADPQPSPVPPFVPGTVAHCNGQAVPLDPRVSVQNPLGTLMYEAFLNAMCAPPPPQ
ncbi:hypothetical protein MYCODSM44623_04364 [Mycobacterium intracellulare subsp. chimaera]|uniref:hypothetical protein n=1 Tax=Mycobacterium intracellulare TaxID=1767 RepID=UPI00093BF883|nr:hypothetical protein [Mycobacterium intracellulare]ASL11056.1 hypothetical protein MYCODSM44623_04364 [Mycobacterium intracellulare subsp. chimaera]MCV7324540.1 hypothetical protein [Mycobacterium intracellulare subsp. chimaera]ORV33102.1 hypothetical protein AWB97_10065 [Mycobacterium intracellulare subsp. chimaera]